MSIHTYKGKLFDSREEVWMAMWLEELKENGFVKFWEKITQPIQLFFPATFQYTKVTQLKKSQKKQLKPFTLLNGLSYTPDFEITWTEKGWKLFVSLIGDEINPKSWFFSYTKHKMTTWVEVKPIFDQNGKTAKFSIIQKILWREQRLFVDLIIPENLFEATFIPKDAMPEFKYKKKPTGKNKGLKGPGDWKTKYLPKTLNQFLNEKA